MGAGGWINLIAAFLVTFKSIESARSIYSKLKKKKYSLWRNILNLGEPQVTQISWYWHELLPMHKLDNKDQNYVRDFDKIFLFPSCEYFRRSTPQKIMGEKLFL